MHYDVEAYPALGEEPRNITTRREPESRRIGKSGRIVTAIGLGCMGLSEFYRPMSRTEQIRVIHRALDSGVTHFDTADMYGHGNNETLVGEALREVRQHVVIATKFGIVRAGGIRRLDASPAYVQRACDDSLRRLGTDYIDLFYLHRLDPLVPIEHTVGAMSRLVEAGKVRHLGLSKIDVDILVRAESVHPIAAVQRQYSLWDRTVERGLLAECCRRDIALVAYTPLGKGILAGRFAPADTFPEGDWRRSDPNYAAESLAKQRERFATFGEIAKAEGCSLAQLALGWLLARHALVLPIPGMRSTVQVDDDVAASRRQLSTSTVEALSDLYPLESVGE